MLKARLILVLLFVVSFSLATYLQPVRAAREEAGGESGGVLALLLGDGRKMFANQFFAKADAYFHRGNYPSIFDNEPHHEENHMAGEAAHGEHAGEDHDEDEHKLAPAQDWIERFGRHFYPTEHVHLEAGGEREMLPWLRLSAELDPHRVATYTVTAYWLRSRLNKVNEAEAFLRDGLRANPNDPEILYELGRLFYESRQDPVRAKNLWLLARKRWQETEASKETPNKLLLEQILGGLAALEVQAGRPREAIPYLKELKAASPDPAEIQKRIDEILTGAVAPPAKSKE